MKILVYQSRIGSGSLTWEHGNFCNIMNNTIIEKCIQSVRNWCNKHKFQYHFETRDLGWNYTFKSKNDNQLNKLLQNWEHLPKDGYDYVIYLDNDVFILDNNSIPPIVDFGLVPRHGDQVLFAQYYLGKSALWFNTGVIVMSKQRCKHFSEWMLQKIKSGNWGELFAHLPREESLTTEYCSINEPSILDYCWNTMPPQTPKPLYKKAKILHLLGTDKNRILKMCTNNIQYKILNYSQVDDILVA